MHPEIEKLIELAIADGQVTEKEKIVILRKAIELGVHSDEVELILDARLHQSQSKQKKSNIEKVGTVKICPACGGSIENLQLNCSFCGHEFNDDSIINKKIRDDIKNLQVQLQNIDNEKIKTLFGVDSNVNSYNPSIANNKKAQVISTFTMPNTKDGLVQLLLFSYSNYESTHDNAFAPNPVKKAWLGKAVQTYNLLKTQNENDDKISSVLINYDFLDLNDKSKSKKKNQIVKLLNKKQGSFTRKVFMGCGTSLLVFGVFIMIVTFKTCHDISNTQNNYKIEAERDDNLVSEVDNLIENNDLITAKEKTKKIKNEFKRQNSKDKILKVQIEEFIENKDFEKSKELIKSLNNEYEKQSLKDKISIIEIETLIEKKDYVTAKEKVKLINNEYTRKNTIEKIDYLTK